VATLAVTRRFDLTDEQWARLAPLLPVATKPGRPSKWTKRQLLGGIRWRVRVGAPWRDVPDCYGSWQAVDSLFRRWQRAGVWQRIVTALRARADAVGLIGREVSVDATVARAHQHAAGARTRPDEQKESPGGVGDGAGGEPADHALGRSRGGLTTKVHLACEQGQKVMSLLATAGQRGDSPQFQAVLEAISAPGWVRDGLARDRTGSGPTRPTAERRRSTGAPVGRGRWRRSCSSPAGRGPGAARPAGSARCGTACRRADGASASARRCRRR
jgi:transposase